MPTAEQILIELRAGTYGFNRAMGVIDRLRKITFKTQMNFLGMMFAGMQLKNSMENLLQPAMEAVGVFDVWNSLLTVFFLPAAMFVLDIMLWLFDVFTSLPEPVQNAANAFVLIAAAIGTVLMVVGQLGLSIPSIVKALFDLGAMGSFFSGLAASITGIIGTIMTAVTGFVTAILSLPGWVIAAIALILLALIVNWEATVKAFMNLIQNSLDGITKIFGGFFTILGGLFDLFVHLFTGQWELLGADIGKIVSGIVDVFKGVFTLTISMGIQFVAELLLAVIGGFDKIISWLLDTFAPGLKKPWEDFKTWVGGIFTWLLEQINAIKKPFDDLITSVGGLLSGSSASANGGKWLPWFENGGVMNSDGLAYLHAGERVLTKEETQNYNGNSAVIYMNNNVSSNVDVDAIGDAVASAWQEKMFRKGLG